MTASITRRDLARIEKEARDEAAEIQRNHPHSGAPALGRKCRICARPDSLELVNRLLVHGLNIPAIVETCQPFNENRPKNFQITYASVRWHAKYHFNVQEPAQAAWRRIMERRKTQHDIEAETIAEGAESLLTVYGFLELLGQKAFEKLMEKDTEVPLDLGMNALIKLEDMTRKGGTEAEMLEMRRQVGVLQQAVRDVVPEQYWQAISERINDVYNPKRDDGSDVLEAEVVEEEDDWGFADEAYSPTVESDPEDSIED